MPTQQAASVVDAFERAFGVIQTRVSVCAAGTGSAASSEDALHGAFAVAYSGGLDSAALLHLAHDYARTHGMSLYAFHVHHGLSSNADHWLAHCKQECAQLGIQFDARQVSLADRDKHGTEQAARISRYAALGELCRLHRVPLLLTAHHQDDQAETVLLQLLRGSGVAGLSGMESVNTAPGLLGGDDLLIGRPLLAVSRADLERFVAQRAVRHVEDESNADSRYARNALRHKIAPALNEYFPGFQERVCRTAQHAQSSQRLLNELAELDLAECLDGECIDIDRLKHFSLDRIDNLLRYWLASRGMRMPATAWLDEMREQLLDAKEDARIRVTHADCEIRRHRGRVFLTPRSDDAELAVAPLSFRWNGEAKIHFPSYGGCLHFDVVEEGIDAAWLREHELLIRYRKGGEKLKPAANRPTRSLKHHYQALNIPSWERLRLPVVTVGDYLLLAAGIGMNWLDIPLGSKQAIKLRWEKAVG
ncbi:MAG: tRNA lysidine(34) synthetase TilS [Noviherbaspirillum sp.]